MAPPIDSGISSEKALKVVISVSSTSAFDVDPSGVATLSRRIAALPPTNSTTPKTTHFVWWRWIGPDTRW